MSDFVHYQTEAKLSYNTTQTKRHHSCAQEILLAITKIKGCGSCFACKMAWLARFISETAVMPLY